MSLSEIEVRVAELAADGTSIAVIAAALGVSAKVADEHLTRVYRKLGAAGRGVTPEA